MTFFVDEIVDFQNDECYPCMIVVQARMSSTRLPGKVLKPISNKPMLSYLTERLRRVQGIEGIVIATTCNPQDDVICQFCDNEGLHCIRGSEEDVLSRYVAACDAFDLEVVIRITSDCPLIDPALISKALNCFRKNYSSLDYLSNTLQRTFPRGMDFEIVRSSVLKSAFFEAKTAHEKEHVTPFIYGHPERFRLGSLIQREDQSAYRLTVDTVEDFELIKRVFEMLYPEKCDFDLTDCIRLLKQHPDWIAINAHVKQKG